MRIGILGVAGRMGGELVAEARAAGHDVVGGTLNPASACPYRGDVPIMSLPALAARADVVIDFTHADAVAGHAEALSAGRAAWVLGTTGISVGQQEAVAVASRHVAILQAAHFGLGINLLANLARQLAALLPAESYDAEIVEMHHRQKVDAPSGSALLLGEAVAEGRHTSLSAVMESGRDGHCGARATGAIGFASLRGGQIVGEHALSFTAAGEQITLSHRAFDRGIFAAGAVRTASWLAGRPPGLYGIDKMLGLPPARDKDER
ncbi:4-hydroxy-tetrahydrodipicolinate reductase [Bosea sp. NBC_00550]|uniref:4-hydroxy-tetrahydrodipicolinate reductase n=1 Tax=Bosea sp. NBC_00550 TaxID=2969621 RepID=UPI00222F5C83|nr:4-hydroxy-tetrahydrodipicolinate reductase [Bosea sp. NBC_00550]UZF90876.1 4-hydroxy-tetrahydrodipicolinate reductase [Bosea sp. NBC_00550]